MQQATRCAKLSSRLLMYSEASHVSVVSGWEGSVAGFSNFLSKQNFLSFHCRLLGKQRESGTERESFVGRSTGTGRKPETKQGKYLRGT